MTASCAGSLVTSKPRDGEIRFTPIDLMRDHGYVALAMAFNWAVASCAATSRRTTSQAALQKAVEPAQSCRCACLLDHRGRSRTIRDRTIIRSRSTRMPVINRIASYHKDMTAWRHDIHSHPETAFEEVRTADVVADKLESFGLEVHRGLAKTGVVGVLRSGKSGRAIGLRADMDALDVHETNAFDHKSTIPGKMHACGHDGHTVMLLGAAKYLAETQELRRHGLLHLPAGRGERGRRPGDGRGGAVREVPGRGRLRHAQHPGHPDRQVRRSSRPDDGRLRHLRGRAQGRRRPRRHAASHASIRSSSARTS